MDSLLIIRVINSFKIYCLVWFVNQVFNVIAQNYFSWLIDGLTKTILIMYFSLCVCEIVLHNMFIVYEHEYAIANFVIAIV